VVQIPHTRARVCLFLALVNITAHLGGQLAPKAPVDPEIALLKLKKERNYGR